MVIIKNRYCDKYQATVIIFTVAKGN